MRISHKFFVDVAAPAALILWILVEAYGAILGPSSMRALRALEVEREQAAADTTLFVGERDRLKRRADMLNPRALDPDLLDERIRAVLGYVEENDLVIPRDQFERALRDSRAKLDATAQ